MCGTMY